MNPNDNRQLSVPARDRPTPKPDRNLAAALMREQIDRIYEQPKPQKETSATLSGTDPYEQSHDNSEGHNTSEAQWHRYHTAWQQYYQQYYDRYYRSQHALQASLRSQAFPAKNTDPEPIIASEVSEDKALDEIKNDLLSKIGDHTTKIRKSRHFIPALSAIFVMGLFLFLQYNTIIFGQIQAFVSPGSINPQNIILDPGKDLKVSQQPRIIIPKLNVDANVVYGVTDLAETTVQKALKDGVIHYPIPGASSNPGEKGNSVFLGHSSNDVFDDGDYKFIFVHLEQMQTGDRFYLHYNGTRYTYTVTATETILPTEVSKLVLPNDKPTATLVTCTPVGTAQKRFIVYADQISPDPSVAADSTQPKTNPTKPAQITGNSPTLFERLFGF